MNLSLLLRVELVPLDLQDVAAVTARLTETGQKLEAQGSRFCKDYNSCSSHPGKANKTLKRDNQMLGRLSTEVTSQRKYNTCNPSAPSSISPGLEAAFLQAQPNCCHILGGTFPTIPPSLSPSPSQNTKEKVGRDLAGGAWVSEARAYLRPHHGAAVNCLLINEAI